MAYALFYNTADLSAIATQVQATLASSYDAFLTTQERASVKQTFNRAWNGGLNAWASAPLAGAQDPNAGDFDARIIVVTGSQVLKSDLISALRTIGAKAPGAQYMLAIADDLQGSAVEPWP